MLDALLGTINQNVTIDHAEIVTGAIDATK